MDDLITKLGVRLAREKVMYEAQKKKVRRMTKHLRDLERKKEEKSTVLVPACCLQAFANEADWKSVNHNHYKPHGLSCSNCDCWYIGSDRLDEYTYTVRLTSVCGTVDERVCDVCDANGGRRDISPLHCDDPVRFVTQYLAHKPNLIQRLKLGQHMDSDCDE